MARDRLKGWPIELNDAAVADAPILGYDLGTGIGDPPPRLRIRQPWIESSGRLDLESFAYWAPLDELVPGKPTTSRDVTSLAQELADNWPKYAAPAALTADFQARVPVPALTVTGETFVALVWDRGIAINAASQVVTALSLYFANYSAEVRDQFVCAKPEVLQQAINWLPGDVRERFVPDAEDYLAAARREHAAHELAMRRQGVLKRLAARWRVRLRRR